MDRTIFAFLLVILFAGCAKRSEVAFHISLFRRPPAQNTVDGGGSPSDLPTNFLVLQSEKLWSRTAPRLIGRSQDPERLRTSLEIRTVHLEETSRSVEADVFVSASGAPKDDIRFALDALVEVYGEYLASIRIGKVSRSR